MYTSSTAYTLVKYERNNAPCSVGPIPAMITQLEVFGADETDKIIGRFSNPVFSGPQSVGPVLLSKVLGGYSLMDIDVRSCIDSRSVCYLSDASVSDIFVLIGSPMLQTERVLVRVRVNRRISFPELYFVSCIAHDLVWNIANATQPLSISYEETPPAITLHEQKRVFVWKHSLRDLSLSSQMIVKSDGAGNVLVAFGYHVKEVIAPAI